MQSRITLLLVVMATCTGCGSRSSSPNIEAAPIDSAALAIFENIVPTKISDPDHTQCLSVNGQDPSDAIISSLIASGHEVARASECTFFPKRPGFRNSTRQPAMFHSIEGLEIFAGPTASADMSSMIHGLNGTQYRLELRFNQGKWLVESKQATGVS